MMLSISQLALVSLVALLTASFTQVHAAATATVSPPPPPMNLRPVIGIVSQPMSSEPGLSYIAASYIKFIEMAGGRAVPLKFGDATSEIDTLMDGINGVLWPGGGADITEVSSKYYQFASHIWNNAIAKNDAGIYFPQWGTCLGFEFIHVMAGGPDLNILTCDFDSEDLPLPLNFTRNARQSGSLLHSMSDPLYKALSVEYLTQNEHKCGVPTSAYDDSSSKISTFFDIKATNVDRNGKPFVSLVEGKLYPVYGMQAHPEKSNFEWVTSEKYPIPHTIHAMEMSQYFANFFVNECRRNSQTLKNETSALMYNYNPTYTGKTGGYFQQTYTFPIIFEK